MNIRKALPDDINEIMSLYSSARNFMRENGNSNQWGSTYPSRDLLEDDIASDSLFVLDDGCEITACFFFRIGEDPTYVRIYDGKWLNNDEYGVIHRIAVKYHGRGIVRQIYDYCSKLAKSIRIDTHRDNLPMHRALLKNGFTRCGIIYLQNGDERIAYHRIS